MTADQSPQGGVPSLRRNGKPPSCEPCRKSKLSCDHVMPICGRCQRRKIPNKCTYHPAPMTGLAVKPTVSRSDAPKHVPRRSASPARGPDDTARRSGWWEDGERVQSSAATCPGFLGSTSYSAVFTESNDQIGLDSDPDTNGIPTGEHTAQEPTVISTDLQRKIADGVAVLALFTELDHLEPIAQRWTDHCRELSLIAPIMPACISSIREDLYEPYIKSRNERALSSASRLLFRNLMCILRPQPHSTFEQYTALMTGKHIRWETVGMFFTACGLGCTHLLTEDPLLDFVGHRPDDRRALARKMLDASNACIAFLDEAGHPNDPSMWLTEDNCILMSQILGDANYLTWRRLGDLSTAIFALGLHQEIKVSPEVPFWLAEYRRRCLAIVYCVDKTMCTFVGRPPRISARYCNIELPLDLDFADLQKDGEDLRQALAQLDENGWNANGTSFTQHTRAFCLVSQIREEILELSLGPHKSDTFEIAADIARRTKGAWESFPESIKYSPDIWSTDQSRDTCVLKAVLYLDVIYNDFMLQRTLVRRIRAKSDEVIRISRLLMTTMIDVLSNHGRFTTLSCDESWMVVLYGLPAAGVLALELLQQTQTRARSSDKFPRSEIIQNLSVFISYLGWVHTEGDGNYHLCMQARRMIQRILDKVLSPEPIAQIAQPSLPTPTNSDFIEDGLFDFSWMDNNAEFVEADFWMSLPDHPLLAVSDQTM